MRVGHLLLTAASDEMRCGFIDLIETLDRLAIPQYVVVGDEAVARRLGACPYVDVGPVVRSPVVASCVMPRVDVAHAHDAGGGQAGLLLTLTRSIPFVLSEEAGGAKNGHTLMQSVRKRARATVVLDGLDAERLIDIYRSASTPDSELPEDADGRQ